jgi:hypothetical protein
MRTSGRIRRVRLAATANVTIATGLKAGQTIDGVVLAEGDEVLLPYQTTASQNGVHVAHSSKPYRSYNFTDLDALNASDIEVVEGTANAGSRWDISIARDGVVGTNDITVSRASTSLLSKSIAGGAGTTVLTEAEASANTIVLTGAITGNRVVEVPARPRQFLVVNNTTGAFTVTVKVNGQTGIVVASTKAAILYTDGTDVERATADA